jgi:hypothetical protein
VSEELIQHDGDAIARRVPQIITFRGEVVSFGSDLSGTLADNRFAEGADDEVSLFAEDTFGQLMDSFGQIYGEFGKAIGLQGNRLDVVRQIGDDTDGRATDHASGWDGSGGGSKG